MELSNLQAFIQVADLGSFSAAAAKMKLTQPAISKRIAALETELGVRLFDRFGRQPHLTEAGYALLPKARRIMDQAEDIRRGLSNLSGEVQGILRCGTSHHIGLHRLPGILQQYTRSYPNVKLDLQFMGSELACAAVERGELELGLITLPLDPPEDLNLTRIWADPMVVVVSQDHALANKGGATMSRLGEYPAVLPEAGTFTRELVQRAFSDYGVTLRCELTTNFLETIRMLVRIGMGWSLIPETMLDDTIKVVDIPGLRLVRHLGVVTHRRRTLSNAAAAMISLCQGAAPRRQVNDILGRS